MLSLKSYNIKKIESDIMDNELIEEIHIMKNHSEGTERIYKHAVKKYTEFCGMSLKELLDEAEAEEDAGIKWKRRKLKRRLLTFRQYLLDNFSLNTVKAMFTPILVIYRYYEIELFELPPINKKAANTSAPIQFEDLPDKEIIRKAVDVATPTIKPIILFMASSGCARMETLNLTIGDYIEAVSEYTNETNIFDIIADLGNCEGVVPTFHIKRQKTGKHFTTFCSPEATLAINNYLLWRIDSLLDRRRLFKVDPNYFTHGFSLVNERLNLGKVGNYNRFRSHMLRKFHASALYNDGMPMEKVNELQGKAKNQTDTAYFMANPDDLKEEYIQHLPALTMSKEIEKITVKSPEFIKMEKENAEYKKRMDGLDEEIRQLKRDVFANIK